MIILLFMGAGIKRLTHPVCLLLQLECYVKDLPERDR